MLLSRSGPPSLDRFDEDDKENCRSVRPFTRALKRKRSALGAMDDNEQTPRPLHKQNKNNRGMQTQTPKPLHKQSTGSRGKQTRTQTQTQMIVPDLAHPSSAPSIDGSEDSSATESHQSGRISPTKQLIVLEYAEEPTVFLDFGWPEDHLAEDAEAIREAIQPLADHRGILGHSVSLIPSTDRTAGRLDVSSRKRTWPISPAPIVHSTPPSADVLHIQKLITPNTPSSALLSRSKRCRSWSKQE